MEIKNSSITFRCDQDFKEILMKIGDKERRSMSQMAMLFIEQGLKNYVKSHPEFMPLLPEHLKS